MPLLPFNHGVTTRSPPTHCVLECHLLHLRFDLLDILGCLLFHTPPPLPPPFFFSSFFVSFFLLFSSFLFSFLLLCFFRADETNDSLLEAPPVGGDAW